MPQAHSISSHIAKDPIERQDESSGYLVGVKILNANQKDVLRAVRFSFEWIKVIFQDLDFFQPITNLITFIKGGEDALCFGEFAQSLCKMGHTLTRGLTNGLTNTIKNLSRNILDLTWNFFKICKSLKNYAIIIIPKAIFVNLMACGGLSFAASSADKTYQNAKELLLLERSGNTQKKEGKALVHLYSLAKNIGTFAVGLIVSLKALIGFTAPGMIMLLLGTTILASNISASIVKEIYHLPNK